jgi:hypothetical protein
MITGMDALTAWVRGWAVSRTSVLLAGEAGRGLYGALGRRVVSSVVPAHVPEEEAA